MPVNPFTAARMTPFLFQAVRPKAVVQTSFIGVNRAPLALLTEIKSLYLMRAKRNPSLFNLVAYHVGGRQRIYGSERKEHVVEFCHLNMETAAVELELAPRYLERRPI